MTSRLGAPQLPIYPVYCHSESPTFGKWCPILACDIHYLRQMDAFRGQNIYFYKNHPIKWVKLTGVIISIDRISTRLILTIDDSSGMSVEATCTAPPEPDTKSILELSKLNTKPAIPPGRSYISPDGPKLNFERIDVGSVVKIHGGLDIFRDQMQIRLKEIRIVCDTNEEVKCWDEASKFRHDILSQPWVVSKEREEKYRKRAERALLKAEKATREEGRRQRATDPAKEQQKEMRDKIQQAGLSNKSSLAAQAGTAQHPLQEIDEAAHRIRQAKLSTKSSLSGQTRPSQKPPRQADETARRNDGLGHCNRANYPPTVSKEGLAGKYDALGL